MNPQNQTESSGPRITLFACQNYDKAPSTAHSLLSDLTEITLHDIHFKCARQVTGDDLRSAYESGADGVLLYGCLLHDCHRSTENLDVLRSIYLHTLTLKELDLAPSRLREEWATTDTPGHLKSVVIDFADRLAVLGPAKFKGCRTAGNGTALEGEA